MPDELHQLVRKFIMKHALNDWGHDFFMEDPDVRAMVALVDLPDALRMFENYRSEDKLRYRAASEYFAWLAEEGHKLDKEA